MRIPVCRTLATGLVAALATVLLVPATVLGDYHEYGYGYQSHAAGETHAAGEIAVRLNGAALQFDVAPRLVNSRVLVPLRAIFEALGAQVEWQGETRTVIATSGSTRLRLTIGETTFQVNGKAMTADVPAEISAGRTLVPLRLVSEVFGAEVQWDDQTRTVTVSTAGPGPAPVAAGPGPAAAAASGTAMVRDGGEALGAQLALNLKGLPAGRYQVRLSGGADAALDLGEVTVTQEGAVERILSAGNVNILGQYHRLELVAAGSGAAALTAELPSGALAHIRHLLVKNPEGGMGYAALLRKQAQGALTHAGFAARADKLAGVKGHADHVHAFLTGGLTGAIPGNANPADNGDAAGYGLTRYAGATRTHAQLAARSADATDAVRLHSTHVANAAQSIVGDGQGGWAAEAAAKARMIATANYEAAGGLGQAQSDAAALEGLIRRILEGMDADGDGAVELIPGEAGAAVAYAHAQNMAWFVLKPAGATMGATAGANRVRVELGDFQFAPASITLPLGLTTTLVLENTGLAPHTFTVAGLDLDVTVRAGETQEVQVTPTRPGSLQLVCRFHAGGGMVGTVTVK